MAYVLSAYRLNAKTTALPQLAITLWDGGTLVTQKYCEGTVVASKECLWLLAKRYKLRAEELFEQLSTLIPNLPPG